MRRASERGEGSGRTPRKGANPNRLGCRIAEAAAGKAAPTIAIEHSPDDIARFERLDRVVKRAVELARGATVVETDHTHLVLRPGVPPALADDARRLEGLIARWFPAPLADGVDNGG